MNDSLRESLGGGVRAALPAQTMPPSDRTGVKMPDYIAGLRMVIATARVASVILAVEGYGCAPQQ